ncbi:c-type cytochrome [Marinomonas atlantica]|uniref:c-type cytochrome n=1 Tax=Marinomonas atlantica TaxID=1806668 RepID=UPI00082E83B7|nr:cytochrome c [Marinomonas atlantica]MCO4785808.1 cytochrome c [Marinomonas atlantica]
MNKWIIVLLLIVLVGCSKKNDEKTNVQNGKELYGLYCATCHATRGTGKFLIGVPRIKDTELQLSQIADLIRNKHSKRDKMPAFQQLTSPQAHSIALYLKRDLRYK